MEKVLDYLDEIDDQLLEDSEEIGFYVDSIDQDGEIIPERFASLREGLMS